MVSVFPYHRSDKWPRRLSFFLFAGLVSAVNLPAQSITADCPWNKDDSTIYFIRGSRDSMQSNGHKSKVVSAQYFGNGFRLHCADSSVTIRSFQLTFDDPASGDLITIHVNGDSFSDSLARTDLGRRITGAGMLTIDAVKMIRDGACFSTRAQFYYVEEYVNAHADDHNPGKIQLVILGLSHFGNQYYNADSVKAVLENIHPDLLFLEEHFGRPSLRSRLGRLLGYGKYSIEQVIGNWYDRYHEQTYTFSYDVEFKFRTDVWKKMVAQEKALEDEMRSLRQRNLPQLH